jgi:secreted PhoX family phosphatase
MQHDEDIVNPTGRSSLIEMIEATDISRRRVLVGGLATAAIGFFGSNIAAASLKSAGRSEFLAKPRGAALIGFAPVSLAEGGGIDPAVSIDYEWDWLIPWGEPIPGLGSSGADFQGLLQSGQLSADEQSRRIGIGHDGMWFFPLIAGPLTRFRANDGMLVINHEFGTNDHVLRKQIPESLEEVRISQHAHGVTVVRLRETNGQWTMAESPNNRRIHVNTPVTFSGPVDAGSALLANAAGNPFQGTVNNCGYGKTPWGTYLACEENFNGYFGTNDAGWTPNTAEQRYGFSALGFGYFWYNFDPRFDLANPDYSNEQNRFGWMVEIDPSDGSKLPVKRTALGRFKHEGGEVVVGQGGRVVVYMGDDQRFDYIYKFVSADNWKAMLDQGTSPLDEGTLYVARFNENNTGQWLPLTMDNPLLSQQFSSLEEILVNTRLAADLLGATPMDRPEWATRGPNGEIFFSLTNNSQRQVPDGPNPLAPNPDGHIIRINDTANHTGTSFGWDIFIIAQTTHGTEESFADPDGLYADPDGRLFIQTDGGQKDGLNNQMVVADINSGEIRRLFTGVPGCEITGVTLTPDRRTMFINVQHPGDGDPSISNFPTPGAGGSDIPRDATVVLRRIDGGIIGS